MSAVNQKKKVKTSQKKHCGESWFCCFSTPLDGLIRGLNTYLENIRNIFSNIVIFCNGILLNVGLPHRPVALWVWRRWGFFPKWPAPLDGVRVHCVCCCCRRCSCNCCNNYHWQNIRSTISNISIFCNCTVAWVVLVPNCPHCHGNSNECGEE